ncbi:MAG: hypothetical protein K2X27_28170 [Candidatus Obscuribacterales bacterium]|nr:hypothetical protein [Candidatus Obscuribacterales bacterium]
MDTSQLTPEALAAISIAVVCLTGLISFVCYSIRRLSRLEGRFEPVYEAASQALEGSQAVNALLSADKSGLLVKQPAYENESLTAYTKTRNVIAESLALRAQLERRQQKAAELKKRFRFRPWWCIASFHLLEEAYAELSLGQTELSTDDLPEKLRENLGSALSTDSFPVCELGLRLGKANGEAGQAYTRLEKAGRAAEEKLASYKKQVIEPSEGSLAGLYSQLQTMGLTHPTYEKAVKRAEALLLELEQGLRSNPLAVENLPAEERLRRLLSRNLRVFRQATKMQENLEALKLREKTLAERVALSRKMPLISGLPGVESTVGGFSFEEEGFHLENELLECRRLMEVLEDSLTRRRLRYFETTRAQLSAKLESGESMLAVVLSDKAFIDEKMGLIRTAAIESDLQADGPELEEIQALYRKQRFHQACALVQALYGEHLKRQEARLAVGNVAEPLSHVFSILRDQINVVSLSVETAFHEYAADAELLQAHAQEGRNDWPSLIARSKDLVARLVEADDSLLKRIQKELQEHKSAAVQIASLKEQSSFLRSKLSEGWGGEPASTTMAQLEDELDSTLAACCGVKLEWSALEKRAAAMLARLVEVRRLIDAALSRHAEAEKQVGKFFEQLELAQSGELYKREICGVVFGSGVFYSGDSHKKELQVLQELLDARQYEKLEAQIAVLCAAVQSENLENFWLVLLEMANGASPGPRVFALEQGFEAGGFKSWAQDRTRESGSQLFSLPPGSSGDQKKRLFHPVQLRAADRPHPSDYEGGKKAAA